MIPNLTHLFSHWSIPLINNVNSFTRKERIGYKIHTPTCPTVLTGLRISSSWYSYASCRSPTFPIRKRWCFIRLVQTVLRSWKNISSSWYTLNWPSMYIVQYFKCLAHLPHAEYNRLVSDIPISLLYRTRTIGLLIRRLSKKLGVWNEDFGYF